MDKEEKQGIQSERHLPEQDAASMNRVVEKAVRDPSLIDYAIGQISGLKFPAYKVDILAHAEEIGAEKHVIRLLESLDSYIHYRDLFHLQKSLQIHLPQTGKFQMSEETRTKPDFRVRPDTPGKGNKEREAVNAEEERKDYPEVTPTAVRVFSCARCGKEFQSPDDLLKHEQFESGSSQARTNSA